MLAALIENVEVEWWCTQKAVKWSAKGKKKFFTLLVCWLHS